MLPTCFPQLPHTAPLHIYYTDPLEDLTTIPLISFPLTDPGYNPRCRRGVWVFVSMHVYVHVQA